MDFDENSLELATIDLLREQGYDYIAGEEISRDYHDVILEDRLFSALQRINPSLQDSTIQEAVRQVKNLSQNNVVRNNKEFTRFLHGGVPVSEYHSEKGTVNTSVYLVDLNNPDNNDFLAVNQFTIIEHSEKRPDLIIFINGLPLVVMELKSMVREEVSLGDAYRQLKNYMSTHIPSLFYYNQFLVISDGATAKAGTITCNYQRFNEWKKTGIAEQVINHNTHEPLIRGMLNKKTLLDLIQNFILFQDDAKILPAYHQYYGVKKAIDQTLATTDGRAGIIWHTQGSGKSFSMVFYTGNMITKLNNPTVIVVTDRNDLDNQLFETFAKCQDFLRQKPVRIESRKDLVEKLEDKQAGGIIFTTLQKFEEETGFLSDRKDILVIADEAHRSHYGIGGKIKIDQDTLTAERKYGTAKYLHDAFPNATYIGFTGTPVEAKDHSTTSVFGEIIDVYDMTQSIEDGATVPLYYEGRMAKVGLNAQILKQIDEYYELLESEDLADDEQIRRSKITKLYNDRTSVADIERVLEQLIELQQDINTETARGNKYDLTDDEKAFFDALGNDPEVRELMKDEVLVQIAKDLLVVLNANMTIDWDRKLSTQAKMRIEIRKLLKKYDYPPKKSQQAVDTVIRQAELKCRNELDMLA